MVLSIRLRRTCIPIAVCALGACSTGDRPDVLVVDQAKAAIVSTTTSTTSTTSTTTTTTTLPATVPASPPSTDSSTTTAPTTTTPAVRTISIAVSGDILPHSPLWRRAADNARFVGAEGFDFDPMLAGLAPLHDTVDLAICHLETPIAPILAEYSTAPIYAVPAEIVDAIADAGYHRCSTASNHTADAGPAGIDRTVEVLEANGLGQSGMARTPDEIEPRVFDVNGVAVSHLSYTFSYNGLSLPKGEPWRSALIDPQRIIADATSARALGAEVVVVSLHWGAERQHVPTASQREVATAITSSGMIDLVVGHHAHVVQPIEQINGTWVVFGLGNILSNLPTSAIWPAASQDAIVVTVTIDVDGVGDATVARPVAHPTWVDKRDGWRVRVLASELADPALDPRRRAEMQASWTRTAAIVGAYVEPVDETFDDHTALEPAVTAP